KRTKFPRMAIKMTRTILAPIKTVALNMKASANEKVPVRIRHMIIIRAKGDINLNTKI
ncbi:hypothetical protein COBT_002396, partial [Conglomerata obtusa]